MNAQVSDQKPEREETKETAKTTETVNETKASSNTKTDAKTSETVHVFKSMVEDAAKEEKKEEKKEEEKNTEEHFEEFKKVIVIVNQKPIVMRGKKNYTFVDIFDYINFDTSKMRGSGIATLINGKDAQYTQELYNGDKIDVYWKE